MTEFTVTKNENARNIGEILKKRGYSNRLIRRLKRIENGITLDGLNARTIDTACCGQIIRLDDEDKNTNSEKIIPNPALNVKILYEDSCAVVFDKPAFMPTHPSLNHTRDTLANFFAAKYSGEIFRPVNRLDRDTSGCVLCAKTQTAACFLQKSLNKVYTGITRSIPFSGGRICAPIAREDFSLITRKVTSEENGGKYAATDFLVRERKNGLCVIDFFLETGRTHQIRVHMAHIGFPLIGDNMYGGCTDFHEINRQALHCSEISFVHPETGKKILVKSPLPDDMLVLLKTSCTGI